MAAVLQMRRGRPAVTRRRPPAVRVRRRRRRSSAASFRGHGRVGRLLGVLGAVVVRVTKVAFKVVIKFTVVVVVVEEFVRRRLVFEPGQTAQSHGRSRRGGPLQFGLAGCVRRFLTSLRSSRAPLRSVPLALQSTFTLAPSGQLRPFQDAGRRLFLTVFLCSKFERHRQHLPKLVRFRLVQILLRLLLLLRRRGSAPRLSLGRRRP
mmetsp:Transcript_17916/g.60459  ORF Transcript_17916/g.60459 Transcript_17916/m.60459 type:complete len:206 (+) Transcript_17916:1223-1840(+)